METVTRNYDHCWLCGRANFDKPPRTFERVSQGKNYVVTSRSCGETPKERCPPLTKEEREDPAMRRFHCKLHSKHELDPGIRGAVLICREEGIHTLYSCDGHKRGDGYIDVWDEHDALRAMNVLRFFDPVYQPRKTHLFGTVHRIILKAELKDARPREPKKP
jgi:hypothetical protein